MINVTPETQFDQNLTAFQCLPSQTREEDGYDPEDYLKEWVEIEPVFCPDENIKAVRFIVFSEYINKPRPANIYSNEQWEKNFNFLNEVFFGDSKEVRALAAKLIECAEWMEMNNK